MPPRQGSTPRERKAFLIWWPTTLVLVNGLGAAGIAVSPKDTMTYTSSYGRAAHDKGVPRGTNGKIMMDNINRYWPDYSARAVTTLDDAKQLVRGHKPIVFLAKNTVTWKYDGRGNKKEVNWPGHFMVVIGYEGKGDPFWIADSSHAQTTCISADELKT
jgi:hypothetical protein